MKTAVDAIFVGRERAYTREVMIHLRVQRALR
jgi:hypothetical protein